MFCFHLDISNHHYPQSEAAFLRPGTFKRYVSAAVWPSVVQSSLAETIKSSRQQHSIAGRPLQGQRTSSAFVRMCVVVGEREQGGVMSRPPVQTLVCEGQ